MDSATIGDDIRPKYEFDWESGPTRTSDEIGDLQEAGLSCTIDQIVQLGKDDPDCTVSIIGFENI